MPYLAMGINSLWYDESGEGEPLTAVHGLGFSHALWEPLRARLTTAVRMLTFDLRGHGRSGPLMGPYHPEVLVEDLRMLLDARGVPATHLIGHGEGALVALLFALKYPARVHRLVLLSGYPECQNREIHQRLALSGARLVSDGARFRLGGVGRPDWWDAPAGQVTIHEESRSAVLLAPVPMWTPFLNACDRPVLVMAGNGRRRESWSSKMLYEALPAGNLVVFDGPCDPLPLSVPGALAPWIDAFLQEQPWPEADGATMWLKPARALGLKDLAR